MKDQNLIFRIQFLSNGDKYELYVHHVSPCHLFGFIEIGDFIWGKQDKQLPDPREEKLKAEFDNVESTLLPMHNILRIDQVKQQGTANISNAGDKVTAFPNPIYSPSTQK